MSRYSFLSLRSPLDERPGPRVLTAMAVGLALGLFWAVVARAWMRLIAEHPAFTVSGTIYILVSFAVVGGLAGLAFALRRQGRRHLGLVARILLVVASAGLAVGAGAPMVVTTLLGTLALVRRSWPAWLRIGLGVLALAPTWLVLIDVFKVAWWRAVPGAVFYFVLLYPFVLAMRTALEPRPARSGAPSEEELHAARI